MRVCIGLITCGRDAYTAQAVSTFAQHNDIEDPRFELVHMAESIDTYEMIADVRAHGFELIGHPKVRIGHQAAVRRICEVAVNRGCDYVVINENDWIWAKPFPWWVLELVQAKRYYFDTCRLFGTMKHNHPLPRNAGTKSLVTGKPLQWTPLPHAPGVEQALAHYVPLSITRTDVLAPWAAKFPGMKKMCRSKDLLSLRLLDNVVWSIGEETTAGFVA